MIKNFDNLFFLGLFFAYVYCSVFQTGRRKTLAGTPRRFAKTDAITTSLST